MSTIVLATGIYPPAIGGPATYVKNLAEQLTAAGHAVKVVTFEVKKATYNEAWPIVTVPIGFPILRWFAYARVLRHHAADADVVYAFSALSVGLPLRLARLKTPKKVLRLGGDVLWERYTDWRGRRTLRDWYGRKPFVLSVLSWLLRAFDHVVFSTAFQERLYERAYTKMPPHSVIENARPAGPLELHAAHEPFRLLYLGRFVRFKNLHNLLRAVANLPHVTLTLIGEGPISRDLSQLARSLHLRNRLVFLPPVSGEEKANAYRDHDLLIIPSITEISPNAALESRSHGLPVLLTDETGLSEDLRDGMMVARLQTSQDITRAVLDIEQRYAEIAAQAASPMRKRGWQEVAAEHVTLFQRVP